MSRWEALGNDFERRAHDLAARSTDLKLQERYSVWARDAVQRCIEHLSSIVQQHTARFPDIVRSELRVEIAEPTTAHAEQRVLCVHFASDSVHLHAQWQGNAQGQRDAQRQSGAPPSLHVLLSRKRAGRDARLITLPGAWLRPSSTPRGFQLCSFDGSSHEIALEELAYRALRLLAAGI